MPHLTVVLRTDGLSTLDAWNAELQAAGLDVVVHPSLPLPPDSDHQDIPMSVGPHTAVLAFNAAPVASPAEWFPVGLPTVQDPGGVACFTWWSDAALCSEAAAWAAAAALADLSYGVVFDAEGLHGESPEFAYQRARELLVDLPAKILAQREAEEAKPDHRSESARRYDAGIDLEGGDEESANWLLAASLRALEERRQRGEKSEPPRERPPWDEPYVLPGGNVHERPGWLRGLIRHPLYLLLGALVLGVVVLILFVLFRPPATPKSFPGPERPTRSGR